MGDEQAIPATKNGAIGLAMKRVSIYRGTALENVLKWDLPKGAGNFLPSIDILCSEIEKKGVCQ